ncbi:MAG: CocE/NonD family hydrolase, partial [Bryobacteraceae bacterium]
MGLYVLCVATASAATPAAVLSQLDVMVPMRDRVRLSANVFRPDVRERVPTILVRTPYNKGSELTGPYQPFVQRGYAVVLQDVRGRFASEGTFRPFDQETPDGDDTLNWIARQTWSDGKVGMVGGSYLGIVQWKAAVSGNPHLKAISPVVSGYDDYLDRYYSRGGALKLGHRLQWMRDNMRVRGHKAPEFERFVLHLPLRTIDRFVTGETTDMLQAVLNHPS